MRSLNFTIILKIVSSVVISVSILCVPILSFAHGDEHHATTQEAQQKIPEKTEDIWKTIDNKVLALSQSLDKNELKNIHHLAFAIRDLVNALPQHSLMLSAEQIKQVKANAKFVATLADRLDESGDKNDKVATQANFEKLKKILELLRKQYPPSENNSTK